MCNLAAFSLTIMAVYGNSTTPRRCSDARDKLRRVSLWHIQVMIVPAPQWLLFLPSANVLSAFMCFAMHSGLTFDVGISRSHHELIVLEQLWRLMDCADCGCLLLVEASSQYVSCVLACWNASSIRCPVPALRKSAACVAAWVPSGNCFFLYEYWKRLRYFFEY